MDLCQLSHNNHINDRCPDYTPEVFCRCFERSTRHLGLRGVSGKFSRLWHRCWWWSIFVNRIGKFRGYILWSGWDGFKDLYSIIILSRRPIYNVFGFRYYCTLNLNSCELFTFRLLWYGNFKAKTAIGQTLLIHEMQQAPFAIDKNSTWYTIAFAKWLNT